MLTDNFLQLTPLDYYTNLLNNKQHSSTIRISPQEAAVILKTHDYGIAQLNSEEARLLHQVVAELKSTTWP